MRGIRAEKSGNTLIKTLTLCQIESSCYFDIIQVTDYAKDVLLKVKDAKGH